MRFPPRSRVELYSPILGLDSPDAQPYGSAMPKARTYDDPCGVARALDRIGERWALLVVRELLLGPKRFTDLREGLPAASPNVLSQRLDELLELGVIERRQLA